jgi:hypothetical protein
MKIHYASSIRPNQKKYLRMKKYTRLFGLLLLLSMAFLTSCEQDDLDGMFGDPVEKFLGKWNCMITGDINGDFGPFTVDVLRNPDQSSEVLIYNFDLQGSDVSARAIIAGNTITIPRQKICDDTIQIQGSGSYTNGEFTLTYKTNDGADEENVFARFYK